MNSPEPGHNPRGRDCCEYYEGLAAEYAVTDLDGRARAHLLVHLERCPRCRHAVCGYTEVADILLSLFPAIEPPLGFEARTLARLERDRLDADTLPALPTPATPTGDTTGRGRRRPGPRWLWRREPGSGTDPLQPHAGAGPRRARFLWLAAAAALVLGIDAALSATGSTTPPAAPAPVPPAPAPVSPIADTAVLYDPLTRGGEHVGKIYAYPGRPTWLQIVLDPDPGTSDPRTSPPGTTTLDARLNCRDGDTITVGPVTVTNGTGAWAGPLAVDPNDLTSVRLTNPAGVRYASADLTE